MKFALVGVVMFTLFLGGCVTINLNGDSNDPVCGNNVCETGETFLSCIDDCFGENPSCGNDVCESGETVLSCPNDCYVLCGDCGDMEKAVCGNEICEFSEDTETCPVDCTNLVACGNGVCESFETSETCEEDCPFEESVCGDRVCEFDETLENCSRDCGDCGNGICDDGETFQRCSYDCPLPIRVCGDAVCGPGEDSETCPIDCSTINGLGNVCGNNECEPGETAVSCAEDCESILIPINQVPSITVIASPSNPSQSLSFSLSISAEDDEGVESLAWETDEFIPFHDHVNTFDCSSQTTCSNTWEELIVVEEGTFTITAYAIDSSGRESGGADVEITVLPFVPYEIDVGPICGNDVCQTGETTSSCPNDCISVEIVSTVCGND
ncbi:MAG TPA: hypothetical protein VFF13_03800, partial [archaeon]|nr:hypothetical protein [archaeon]